MDEWPSEGISMLNTSKRKRILITGGSGFLGWHLARELRYDFDIAYTDSAHPITIPSCRAIHLDLSHSFSVANCLYEFQPDIVIHAAALADTGYCERFQERAYEINVAGTERLLHHLCDVKTRFIYISTDLVFDGEHAPCREDSPTHPLSYYAQTKLQAEQRVQSHWKNYVILRTALMYGAANANGKGSFLQWLEGTLAKGESLTLFTDEYRTPIYVGDIVRAVKILCAHSGPQRLYHLGGAERISRYDFGLRLAALRGYNASLIQPKKINEMRTPMPRARDVSLDSSRIQLSLGLRLTTIDSALQACAAERVG